MMRTTLLFLIAISLSSEVQAGIRFGAGAGTWFGSYEETYGTSHSQLSLNPSLGIHTFLGFSHKLFFVHWAPTLLSSDKISEKSNDSARANYIVPLGFELGISGLNSDFLPPIEIYLGGEYGALNFVNGTKTSLSGSALKIGAQYLPFHFGSSNNFGFRIELRKHFMSIDNYGPIAVETNISTVYIGIVYEFSKLKTEEPEKLD